MADHDERAWKVDPIQTVGRRKEAVARVILRPGDGQWEVNGKELDAYFSLLRHRETVSRPLQHTDSEGMFDIQVRTDGGGLAGQADAVQLGVARALVEWDDEMKDELRAEGYLTRDPRIVERKKPGQPKARKKGQFSKR